MSFFQPFQTKLFRSCGLTLWLYFTRRWGRFCARHPVLIIVCGLAVCVACTAGVAMFKVTTDPVELWSAPGSRARREKEYFDTHFT